jgi:hypothetical protein
LADVVVDVGGAIENHGEAVLGGGTLRGVVGGPFFRGLLADGVDDQGNGAIEGAEDILLGGASGFCEFAVADVTAGGDLSADVIVQIPGQVQDEMSDVVAVGIGISPELFLGQRIDPFVELGGHFVEIVG